MGQYEFLRTQYPGSSLRVGALLAEGQIYENDLHDAAAARERYSLLVKQYPRSAQAEEAKAGIASLSAGNREEGVGSRGPVGARASDLGDGSASPATGSAVSKEKTLVEGNGASSFAPMPTTGNARGSKATPVVASVDAGDADRRGTSVPVDAELDASTAAGQEGSLQAAGPMHVAKTGAKRHGQLAQVTGIRHWSTPDYTRVAIDLGDDVTYEAARVPNPDRIYFDLHGTRLAQELVGKSFSVTDDGFLKKIRAAQFSNDMTRVVLDVNDVTEYSAFLLPNPYRLIIDIHGGSKAEPGAPGSSCADAAGGRGRSYGAEYYGGEGGELVRCGGVECAAGEGGGDDAADLAADLGGGVGQGPGCGARDSVSMVWIRVRTLRCRVLLRRRRRVRR